MLGTQVLKDWPVATVQQKLTSVEPAEYKPLGSEAKEDGRTRKGQKDKKEGAEGQEKKKKSTFSNARKSPLSASLFAVLHGCR